MSFHSWFRSPKNLSRVLSGRCPAHWNSLGIHGQKEDAKLRCSIGQHYFRAEDASGRYLGFCGFEVRTMVAIQFSEHWAYTLPGSLHQCEGGFQSQSQCCELSRQGPVGGERLGIHGRVDYPFGPRVQTRLASLPSEAAYFSCTCVWKTGSGLSCVPRQGRPSVCLLVSGGFKVPLWRVRLSTSGRWRAPWHSRARHHPFEPSCSTALGHRSACQRLKQDWC